MSHSKWRTVRILALALPLVGVWPGRVCAAPPVVKTVRAVSSDPLIPHDICSGVLTRLKGTSDVSGSNIQYSWDFGDGSARSPATTVLSGYVLEASHVYNAGVGTSFNATLTVRNTSTGEETAAIYFLKIQPCVLATRVNMAIDEGLWYLHKSMTRALSFGTTVGYWAAPWVGSGYPGNDATNVRAFEAHGFLMTGPPDDPYTETVSRGLNRLFLSLSAASVSSSVSNPYGVFNPDGNGNGLGIRAGSYPMYEGGMVLDALVSSGTPSAIAATGPANVVGRQYRAIVQDMVDYFSYCQHYDGGWRYGCADGSDNAAGQWVAIGLIAAVRQWGAILPQPVRLLNGDWLRDTQSSATGTFGYTHVGYYPWGPYATTASGMTQLAMDGIGRGNPMWDKAETFMRDNFGNSGECWNALKDYYYGLYGFTTAMLVHDSNNDSVAEPLNLLRSSTPGTGYLRWYDAEAGVDQGVSQAETGIPGGIPLGAAPTHGVARTLVDDQHPDGYWSGHDCDSSQTYFETGWALTMLRRSSAIAYPGCVTNLAARAKPGKVDLTWSWRAGAGHYNVYRAATSGGPYANIGVVGGAGLTG